MIKIEQAIIVEGKYDKIKVSSFIDAVIIVTNGFGIFTDREKLELIRFYAMKTGIVILTDSDKAGFAIRNHIKGTVRNGKIYNVYIPDIMGKEGKLGVEGVEKNIILKAFEKAGILTSECEKDDTQKITKTDLYLMGLSGGKNSAVLRKRLLEYLKLPSLLTANSMLEVLNTMMDREQLQNIIADNIIFGG